MKLSDLIPIPIPLCSGEVDTKWQEGAILHCRGNKTIRKCLTKWQRRLLEENDLPCKTSQAYGTHDAVCCYKDGHKGFGEMSIDARQGIWTPIEEYQADIIHGKVILWYLWPIGATARHGKEAAAAWSQLEGKPYDFSALPRLYIKCVFMDWQDWPWPFSIVGDWQAGKKFAWYCTESVKESWEPIFPIYHKTNPTPLTTEHRAGWNWSKGGLITLRAL